MRILLNGYFYGGNCPPFFTQLKKIEPDIKLTNSLGFLDAHGINLDYITEDDIIDIKFKRIEKLIIKGFRKFRIGFWKKLMVKKYQKLVETYNPDIIINHKVSEKSEIMLKTGFRPQVTYIYGGEVHGKNVMNKSLDYSFSHSDQIMIATIEIFEHVVKNRPYLRNKLNLYPMGAYNYSEVLGYKKRNSVAELRKEYGLNQDVKIFIDSRSLRGLNTGITQILEASSILAEEDEGFLLVLLKGHLGTTKVIEYVEDYLKSHPKLKEKVKIYNRLLSNQEIRDFYFLSDCFISLLPNDQFGSSIMDALFLDNQLILRDLLPYRNELGEHVYYINDTLPSSLKNAMANVINGVEINFPVELKQKLADKYDGNNNFTNIYTFLKSLIK